LTENINENFNKKNVKEDKSKESSSGEDDDDDDEEEENEEDEDGLQIKKTTNTDSNSTEQVRYAKTNKKVTFEGLVNKIICRIREFDYNEYK